MRQVVKSPVGRRILGGSILALLAVVGGPDEAGAVVHNFQAMTATQQSVPNASVHVTPDIGMTGTLNVNPQTGLLTTPGGYGLFNLQTTRPITQTYSDLTTTDNWRILENRYKLTFTGGGSTTTPIEPYKWTQKDFGYHFGSGWDLGVRYKWNTTFPTGTATTGSGTSGYTPFGPSSGGSPFVGVTNATGGLAWDYPGSLSGFNWSGLPSKPRLGVTAGLSCEGAFRPITDGTVGSTVKLPYVEPCEDACFLHNYVPRTEMDWCSTMQLPTGVFQAQIGAPPADMNGQWAFTKLGLPIQLPVEALAPVIVAVIDSGVDYRHPQIPPESLWTNPRPGSDPEFKNDVLGWDFVAKHNNPWDDVGHGTFVAGLILAINPAAKIMPLKVLDVFGNGLNSDIGRAVLYAVDHGARVINISIGTKAVSDLQQAVVDYAREHGVVIVTAAGNEGIDTAEFTPAGVKGVLTVAATDQNDKKPPFGNWGQNVALAAPGVDVVSLRARWTDFVLVATMGKDYKPGANFVGADKWLYRASGTSFAAPFVSGAASLLFSVYPNLVGKQVERMLVQSANDIETPGWDQFTGAGRLNIVRALFTDPNAYLTAKVSRIEPTQEQGKPVIKVVGTADGNRLERYEVQVGQGEAPARWKTVAAQKGRSVEDGVLAAIPISEITARGKWSVRVLVTDRDGRSKEARGALDVN